MVVRFLYNTVFDRFDRIYFANKMANETGGLWLPQDPTPFTALYMATTAKVAPVCIYATILLFFWNPGLQITRTCDANHSIDGYPKMHLHIILYLV